MCSLLVHALAPSCPADPIEERLERCVLLERLCRCYYARATGECVAERMQGRAASDVTRRRPSRPRGKHPRLRQQGLQEMTGALSPRCTSRLAAAHRWLPQCQPWRGGAIAAKRSCWVSNSVGRGCDLCFHASQGYNRRIACRRGLREFARDLPPLFARSHFLVDTSVCRFGLLSASPGHGRARQCC